MTAVLKWSVPVDGLTHAIGGGRVAHVDRQAADGPDVHVWTVEPDPPASRAPTRTAKVWADGKLDPTRGALLGSTDAGHVYADRP